MNLNVVHNSKVHFLLFSLFLNTFKCHIERRVVAWHSCHYLRRPVLHVEAIVGFVVRKIRASLIYHRYHVDMVKLKRSLTKKLTFSTVAKETENKHIKNVIKESQVGGDQNVVTIIMIREYL